MKRILFAFLTLLATATGMHAQVISGYIPEYEGTNVDGVNYNGLTDVFYQISYLANPSKVYNANGQLQVFSPSVFSDVLGHCQTTGVKVWLTMLDDGTTLTPVTSSPQACATFASSCVTFCQQYGLKGIDIDWEVPSTAQASNFKNMLSAIHTAFQNASGNLKLSIAVENYTTGNGVSADILQYVDYVHLMAYYPGTNANYSSVSAMEAMMTGWANAGCPYSKMIVGIPFYGVDGTGTAYKYSDINAGRSAAVYGESTDGTYFYNGTDIIGQKIQYIMSKGCLGFFSWELCQDLLNNSPYSLLTACEQDMIANSRCFDKNEPNDNTASATPLFSVPLTTTAKTVSIQGYIPDPSDQDWFSIPVSGTGTLSLSLTNLSADYDLELYPLSGLAGGALQGSYNIGTANESITYGYSTPASTKFFAKVYPKSTGSSVCGAYALTATWTPTSTVTTCTTPTAPVATFGADDCTSSTAISGTTATLAFTSQGGNAFSAQVSQFPYGSSNIVASTGCQPAIPFSVNGLIPGMLYRWNMYAYGATDCSSCESALSNTKYFSIAPIITSSGTQIPSGGSITLSTTPQSPGTGASVNYRWLVNGTAYQSGATLTSISLNQAGVYTLIIDYTGSSDCSTTASTPASNAISVTENNSCVPSATPTSINQVSTGNNSYTLSVVGGSLGTNAQWNWYAVSCGGFYLGTGSSIVVTPQQTTTFFVRGEGNCGISNCASVTINVTSCTASIKPNLVTQQMSADGKSLQLIVIGGSLGTNATWKWYTGTCGGTLYASGAGTSIVVDPTVNQTYYVRGEGDCGVTDCDTTTVTNCIPSTIPDSLTSIKTGNGVLLVVHGGTIGTNGSFYFTRDNCNGTPAGSGRADTIRVFPTKTTTYFVQALGCNLSQGCVSTTVYVYPQPQITGFNPATAIPGSEITISGSGFSGATDVAFGGTASTSFNVVSDNTITAIAGLGSSGAITVTTPGGLAADTGFRLNFQLPPQNFSISSSDATCHAIADGSITISAVQVLNYIAKLSVNGVNTSYPFNGVLNIPNLAAGNYQLCVYVNGEPTFQQCYNLKISEPPALSVYQVVNIGGNTLTLNLSGGATYIIKLGSANYVTQDSTITLPLIAGDNSLSVTTEKLCQGEYKAIIHVLDNMVPFPIPFSDVLKVNLGVEVASVGIFKIYDVQSGKLVFTEHKDNPAGIVSFNLSSLPTGVYALHVSLDGVEKIFKINKQ